MALRLARSRLLSLTWTNKHLIGRALSTSKGGDDVAEKLRQILQEFRHEDTSASPAPRITTTSSFPSTFYEDQQDEVVTSMKQVLLNIGSDGRLAQAEMKIILQELDDQPRVQLDSFYKFSSLSSK